MKTIIKLTAAALIFSCGALTAAVTFDRAVSDPDYHPHATTALERIDVSAAVLREVSPFATPDDLSGEFVAQAVAVIDEALRHLESIQPSVFDQQAWAVHRHFMAQFKECRILLDQLNERGAYLTSELMELGKICDPIPGDDPVPMSGGSTPPKVEQ